MIFFGNTSEDISNRISNMGVAEALRKSIEVFDKRVDEIQKQITDLKEQVDMVKVRMYNVEREFVKKEG